MLPFRKSSVSSHPSSPARFDKIPHRASLVKLLVSLQQIIKRSKRRMHPDPWNVLNPWAEDRKVKTGLASHEDSLSILEHRARSRWQTLRSSLPGSCPRPAPLPAPIRVIVDPIVVSVAHSPAFAVHQRRLDQTIHTLNAATLRSAPCKSVSHLQRRLVPGGAGLHVLRLGKLVGNAEATQAVELVAGGYPLHVLPALLAQLLQRGQNLLLQHLSETNGACSGRRRAGGLADSRDGPK